MNRVTSASGQKSGHISAESERVGHHFAPTQQGTMNRPVTRPAVLGRTRKQHCANRARHGPCQGYHLRSRPGDRRGSGG